jgi:hypothetical protein
MPASNVRGERSTDRDQNGDPRRDRRAEKSGRPAHDCPGNPDRDLGDPEPAQCRRKSIGFRAVVALDRRPHTWAK